MAKQIAIMVLIGVVFLSIVSYFTFGFGNKPSIGVPSTDKPKAETAAEQPPPKIPENLKIEDTQIGTGSAVKSGDIISINYAGTLEDGTPFDNSYDRGEPFETQIGVGNVIKGWDLGVIGMKVGGKRRLTIPPELGYGDQASEKIPANSTLIFDVELMGIK